MFTTTNHHRRVIDCMIGGMWGGVVKCCEWPLVGGVLYQRSSFTTCGSLPPAATNVERSVKDLQRCSASLTRYRMVVKEEMDTSIKRMKQTFAELQSW